VIAALLLLASGCPVLAPAPGGVGSPAVVHTPTATAMALNNEGKALYRQGRWTEARARYQAALATDPEWLAPALNAACALNRQERFADAAAEAAALIRRGFVPWGRETLEAVDLATLHVRPEMKLLRSAATEAAVAWGASLADGLFLVARTRPAVKLEGKGVLVLGLNQEVFAWLPSTGRYRQVTNDDGRVLAALRAQDGKSVVYVRAGKLVMSPGQSPALRGLSLRRLALGTMAAAEPIDLPGDILELSLWPGRGGAIELRVRSVEGVRDYQLIGEALAPVPALSLETRARPPVRLSAAGVDGGEAVNGPAGCAFHAETERKAGQPSRVRVTAGKKSVVLDAPLGAGLFGLPFGAEPPKTAR
jgi:hypothetical protein